MGANLYRQHLARKNRDTSSTTQDGSDAEYRDPELPESRQMPPGVHLTKQTVHDVEALLVSTGVYSPSLPNSLSSRMSNMRSHKDFVITPELLQPGAIFDHISSAVDYILRKENL